MTQDQMYDVADSIMAQKLSQIEGVGQVFVWGQSQPAVRIEVNPKLLNQLGVGLEQVRTAVAAQNVNVAKGSLHNGQYQLDRADQRPAQEGQGLQAAHRRLPQRCSGAPAATSPLSVDSIRTSTTPAVSTANPACC